MLLKPGGLRQNNYQKIKLEKKGAPILQHALNYNPPKRLAPWSIELMCMRDEEVFSFCIPVFNSNVPR